jgi:hypothetical protein
MIEYDWDDGEIIFNGLIIDGEKIESEWNII